MSLLYERKPTREEDQWWALFPVNENGMPTSRAAFRLINRLFEHHGQIFSLDKLAEELWEPADLLEIMCKQLAILDIVNSPDYGKSYQYNLCCRNPEFQGKVEAWLLDFYQEAARRHTSGGDTIAVSPSNPISIYAGD